MFRLKFWSPERVALLITFSVVLSINNVLPVKSWIPLKVIPSVPFPNEMAILLYADKSDVASVGPDWTALLVAVTLLIASIKDIILPVKVTAKLSSAVLPITLVEVFASTITCAVE